MLNANILDSKTKHMEDSQIMSSSCYLQTPVKYKIHYPLLIPSEKEKDAVLNVTSYVQVEIHSE